jgi:hypothetical protein
MTDAEPVPGASRVWPTTLRRVGLGLIAVFLLMQLVPYGWKHENPPEISSVTFPSAEAATLFKSACADCHSNRSNWPVWSFVAPFSWLVRKDVDEGREAWNVSDWDRAERDADEAVEVIDEGEMPPSSYVWLHPNAKLSDKEKQVLIDAFNELDRTGG